jgi:hypothetical protein
VGVIRFKSVNAKVLLAPSAFYCGRSIKGQYSCHDLKIVSVKTITPQAAAYIFDVAH